MSLRANTVIMVLILVGCQSDPAASTSVQTDTPTEALNAADYSVTVDEDGFHPATIEVPAGTSVTIAFTRATEDGCGHELVLPDLGIRRDLPLNEAVAVNVVTPTSGRISFTCGMGMMRGAIVVN